MYYYLQWVMWEVVEPPTSHFFDVVDLFAELLGKTPMNARKTSWII